MSERKKLMSDQSNTELAEGIARAAISECDRLSDSPTMMLSGTSLRILAENHLALLARLDAVTRERDEAIELAGQIRDALAEAVGPDNIPDFPRG
jgi:hypothetical protein